MLTLWHVSQPHSTILLNADFVQVLFVKNPSQHAGRISIAQSKEILSGQWCVACLKLKFLQADLRYTSALLSHLFVSSSLSTGLPLQGRPSAEGVACGKGNM